MGIHGNNFLLPKRQRIKSINWRVLVFYPAHLSYTFEKLANYQKTDNVLFVRAEKTVCLVS